MGLETRLCEEFHGVSLCGSLVETIGFCILFLRTKKVDDATSQAVVVRLSSTAVVGGNIMVDGTLRIVRESRFRLYGDNSEDLYASTSVPRISILRAGAQFRHEEWGHKEGDVNEKGMKIK